MHVTHHMDRMTHLASMIVANDPPRWMPTDIDDVLDRLYNERDENKAKRMIRNLQRTGRIDGWL